MTQQAYINGINLPRHIGITREGDLITLHIRKRNWVYGVMFGVFGCFIAYMSISTLISVLSGNDISITIVGQGASALSQPLMILFVIGLTLLSVCFFYMAALALTKKTTIKATPEQIEIRHHILNRVTKTAFCKWIDIRTIVVCLSEKDTNKVKFFKIFFKKQKSVHVERSLDVDTSLKIRDFLLHEGVRYKHLGTSATLPTQQSLHTLKELQTNVQKNIHVTTEHNSIVLAINHRNWTQDIPLIVVSIFPASLMYLAIQSGVLTAIFTNIVHNPEVELWAKCIAVAMFFVIPFFVFFCLITMLTHFFGKTIFKIESDSVEMEVWWVGIIPKRKSVSWSDVAAIGMAKDYTTVDLYLKNAEVAKMGTWLRDYELFVVQDFLQYQDGKNKEIETGVNGLFNG